MSKKLLTIIVVGNSTMMLLLISMFVLLLWQNKATIGPIDSVTPNVDSHLEVIYVKARKSEYARNFAQFYRQWAIVVAESDQLTSTELHRRATAISLQAGVDIGYLANEGFGLHIDAVITQAIGLDNRSFDDDTRRELVKALNSIADAFEGK